MTEVKQNSKTKNRDNASLWRSWIGISSVIIGTIMIGTFIYRKQKQYRLIHFYKNDRRFIQIAKRISDKPRIKVMSYNILADGPRYALSEQYNYTDIKYRLWEYRFPRIMAQIKAYNPDVICFQELTFDNCNQHINKSMKYCGYEWFLSVGQNGRIGNGIYYKSEKFELIHQKKVNLGKSSKKAIYDEYFGHKKSEFRKQIKQLSQSLVVMHFRIKNSEREIICCGSHFYWNPDEPHIKVAQCIIMYEELWNIIENEWKLDEFIPVCMLLDANSVPKINDDQQSGVYQLMNDWHLDKTHPHHPYSFIKNQVTKKLDNLDIKLDMDNIDLDEYPFIKEYIYIQNIKDYEFDDGWKSSYGVSFTNEPIFTNRTPTFSNCIDYIMINDGFRTISYLEMPYQRKCFSHIINLHVFNDPTILLSDNNTNTNSQTSTENDASNMIKYAHNFDYLPNPIYPSDHLCLVSELELMPTKQEQDKLITHLQ